MRMILLNYFGLLLLPLLLSGFFVDSFAQVDPVLTEATELTEVGDADETRFVYSPKGRRDPFAPLVQEKQKIAKKINRRSEKIKGQLEKFELSQYRLIAMMVVKGIPRAMVKAPDGKSYTVKLGEYIGMNDGLVKRIETKTVSIGENGMRVEKSPDRIVVEEIGIDSVSGKTVKENRYIVM